MAVVTRAQLTNRLKWKATLLVLVKKVDEDDRPVSEYTSVRKLNFADVGITDNEKYLAMQAKTDVVRKIQCRLDKTVSQKNNRVQIGETAFLITRIYVDEQNKMMELSLNYVD